MQALTRDFRERMDLRHKRAHAKEELRAGLARQQRDEARGSMRERHEGSAYSMEMDEAQKNEGRKLGVRTSTNSPIYPRSALSCGKCGMTGHATEACLQRGGPRTRGAGPRVWRSDSGWSVTTQHEPLFGRSDGGGHSVASTPGPSWMQRLAEGANITTEGAAIMPDLWPGGEPGVPDHMTYIRSQVGRMMWQAHARPDLAAPVRRLARRILEAGALQTYYCGNEPRVRNLSSCLDPTQAKGIWMSFSPGRFVTVGYFDHSSRRFLGWSR